MKIAVQTRPWGVERNRTDLDGVLGEVAAAGYDGFEIGAQHLNLAEPEALLRLAQRHGLAVAGIHAGGDLADPASVTAARQQIELILHNIVAVGASFLPFSGKQTPHKTPADLQTEVENLNRIGELCADRGVTLCYHNHNWEIANQYAELQAIVDGTDPALVSLCLDVAWVYRGGEDPLAAVERFGLRIAYVHLKDTTPDTWMELGRGELDLPPLIQRIQALHLPWITVEQDEVARPAQESATISRAYLRNVGVGDARS